MDLVVASSTTADLLFRAGFELIEQGFVMNGHRCFRFLVKPGEGKRLDLLLRGKGVPKRAPWVHDRSACAHQS